MRRLTLTCEHYEFYKDLLYCDLIFSLQCTVGLFVNII